MTTQEVATVCRTSPETIRYWRHVGEGPKSFKVGRRVLYRRSDVEAWMRSKAGDDGGEVAITQSQSTSCPNCGHTLTVSVS